MTDFEITNSNREKCSFAEVIGTEPVVVCHSVDPLEELDYYRYLDSLGHRVVLIISRDNPLIHIMMLTHDFKMETYTDHAQNFITHLKKQWSLELDTSTLVKQLRCQILYVNGKETKNWKQPVSDQWNHFNADREAFKKFHKQFGMFGITWLRKQDINLWNRPIKESGQDNKYYAHNLFMKHYHLLPNNELEQELKLLA